MAFSDEFKKLVKDTARIEEVIQKYTGSVQQRGNNFVAVCPFHDDHNPSLFINTSTQTWSCNSCGAGSRSHSIATSSDVFGFVKGFTQKSFPETVAEVAMMYNIPLPNIDPQAQMKAEKHDWWVNETKMSQERFKQNLMNEESHESYRYLLDRGFDDTMIELFGLGLGDDVKAEFINTKSRITFPIYNTRNEIISFTGRLPMNDTSLRKLNDERLEAWKNRSESERKGKPFYELKKYNHRFPLNDRYKGITPDYVKNHPYPKFEKSKALFGIQLAASSIQKWHRATIVEGFTDVMRLHQHGISNAVGTMGTSLSKEQCRMLRNAGVRVALLMRDGDSAGIDAMERDSVVLAEFGIDVEIMPLPPGHDPDSLGLQFNVLSNEYSRYINSKTCLLAEWRVKRAFDLEDENLNFHLHEVTNIRLRRIESVAKAIAEEKDITMRDVLTYRYAEELHLSVESLVKESNKYMQK